MASPSPGVRVLLPPPAWFLIALGLGVGLGYLHPLALSALPDGLRFALAALLMWLALLVGAWGLWTLRRHQASPEFNREVAALVRQGPYRFSRNPLYGALGSLLAGLGLLLDNAWILAEVPLLVIVLDRLVIALEERYLRQRFGAVYEDYCRAVRRWL